MKRILLISAVCVLFVLASKPVMADMIVNLQYKFPGRLGSTNGGEFLMTVEEGPIGIYSETDSFTTFCLETNEFVNNDQDYFVTISTEAVNGGSGGPSPDPLSAKSAYLYSLWLDGTDGTHTINYDSATANGIQEAIWYIEEESLGVDNSFVDWADAAVLPGGSWHTLWGNTIGDIRVMNLWKNDYYDGLAQDQLVRVPVPAAVLLGIIGLGVAGMKLRKYA